MDDFFAALSPWWPPGRADLHWHLLPKPDRLAAVAAGLGASCIGLCLFFFACRNALML